MQMTNAAISVGRLMSPEEVHQATRRRTDLPEHLRRQWYLCADIPSPCWDALADNGCDQGYRLTAFAAPDQTAYAIFTVQVDAVQVRFLLPLGSHKIDRFLRDATDAGLMLSLSTTGGYQALIRQFPIVPASVGPVWEIAKSCQVRGHIDTVFELALVMPSAREPSTVPSMLPNHMVEDVHPVVILPEDESGERMRA